jgi:hypothetical protein
MRIILFSLLFIPLISFSDYFDYIYKDRGPSFNSFGQVGLIQTPTARTQGENSIHLILNNNQMWKFGSLTATPFDWFEASYFYYRPRDLTWTGSGKKGEYLDKGFNVKFVYTPQNNKMPSLAVGLDDIGGTGYFSREYIASTFQNNKLNLTLGVGWGKFNNISSFSNPLRIIDDKFNFRPGRQDRIESGEYGVGGTFATSSWFRGEVSLFGGIEIYIPKTNGLKFKVEHDPFDYFDFSADFRNDAINKLRKKDSNINYGLSYPINDNFSIEASFIKGNTLNFSFTIGRSFKKKKKTRFKPDIKKTVDNSSGGFYKDLLLNLNSNELFLQTADIKDDKKELRLGITNSSYMNHIRASSYAAKIAKETLDMHNLDINLITINNVNVGIELNEISFYSEHLDENNKIPLEVVKNYTLVDSGTKNSYKLNRFQPVINFPLFFNSINPNLVSHIGSPDKFYFGGIIFENKSELLLKRNLILTSKININVFNNFDQTPDRPDSRLPHVRTDIVKYLQQSKDIHFENFQLDYFFTPSKDVYSKFSVGIFEKMYGGLGLEILHKPFEKNYYFGLETFYVTKRDFNQMFDFLDYKTLTSHLMFNYFFEPLDINLNLSYGRYLAKDEGYTFDLSRVSNLGIRMGFFFTRTNVSAELFGEGSFDKGFYFQIPIDLFIRDYSSSTADFRLTPLTRDGGQKLKFEKSLQGLIHNSNLYEINRQWDGYLD